jgi:heat shock protein HslJ
MLVVKKGNTVLAKFARIKNTTAGADDLNGNWELDYLLDSGSSFDSLYANRRPTISFDVTEKKVNGNSSCNNFFGTFEIQGNKLNFGPLGSTKMACPGDGEKVFFNSLEKVATYAVHDDKLVMIMGDIVVMRWKRK